MSVTSRFGNSEYLKSGQRIVLVEEIVDFITWWVYMEWCESIAGGKTKNTFPKIKFLYSKENTED